ncbi:hydro-lyase, tartrate/fumarate family, beta subunit [Salmonella enterica subsp. enterica]|nr:hydro-lyase, tartrate/fumarate family, beta subunit [Salmonella enterica subsp. enterica]
MMELTLPLTKEKAKTLKVGDILFLTGFAYTCRDAAHKKIEVALSNGEKSPVDFQKPNDLLCWPPALPDLVYLLAPTVLQRPRVWTHL